MTVLRYEDSIPLHWRPLDALPTGDNLDRLDRHNERVLALLPSLETPTEPVLDEEPPRHLQVLEQRLQLLTELLGELLAQQRPLPPVRSVALSAEDIEWSDDTPPRAGATVMVEIYLHRLLPGPLRLPVTVERQEPDGAGERVVGRLASVGDSVVAELEKLIFRQHRRAIANRRQR